MFKEISDIKKVCETINSKSEKIKNLATELDKLMEEIKSKASQEEAVNITLAIRKELTNLFILNSNIEDNFNTLQRIFNSTKEEFLKILQE
ncbi:MAG: hypothetical protein WA120_02090 [Candidatus Hydromicrobium sp.]